MTSQSAKSVRDARPIPVTAFVDWNSQIHNAKATALDPVDRARQTLQRTARVVRRMLAGEDPTRRFDVGLRLYHGWHKGWEKTDNLRAIMQIAADLEFPADYSAPNVMFRQAVQYGHTLLCALPQRQHIGQQIHFANTLRRRSEKSRPNNEEKLVDTALAADILHWARESPAEWALVLAEDDDIVPPVFTAEAWITAFGGRAFILRARQADAYLRLSGLLKEWKP